MKIFPILLLLFLFQTTIHAQSVLSIDDSSSTNIKHSTVQGNQIKKGNITSYNTTEIDSLIAFQKKISKANCPNLVKGYRVQIYSCSGSGCQEKADKNYNQFLIAYPEYAAEIIWEAPSYKVRVGNCRNRFEAEGIKAKIKVDFPFIFVVPDYISSPFKVDCEEMK